MAYANNTYIPSGWNFDAYSRSYKHVNGDIVTENDVKQYGSLTHALMARTQNKVYTTNNTTPTPKVGDMRTNANSFLVEVYDGKNWVVQSTNLHGDPQSVEKMRIDNSGMLSVSAVKPAAEITVQGKLGTITINLDTGELKMPPNVGRDAAIRDFWLGFQENFQPTNKAEYENDIRELKKEVARLQVANLHTEKDADKKASKKVSEKILAKYGGEKFIMVKPDDLIKFIEGE